jgi:hypothetical protein
MSLLGMVFIFVRMQVWSVGAGGDRYQRWWGEQHLGDMRVRRHGHSTTGELHDAAGLLAISAWHAVPYYEY